MNYIITEEEYNKFKEYEKFYNTKTLHIQIGCHSVHSSVGEEFDDTIKNIIVTLQTKINKLSEQNIKLDLEIKDLKYKLYNKKWYQVYKNE